MPTSTRAVGIQILLKPYSKNGRAPRADRVVRPYRTFFVFAGGLRNFVIAPCRGERGIDPYEDITFSPSVV